MPQIAEIREIDGEIWVRVGGPEEVPSGVAIWTPDEQEAMKKQEREACAVQILWMQNLGPNEIPLDTRRNRVLQEAAARLRVSQ